MTKPVSSDPASEPEVPPLDDAVAPEPEPEPEPLTPERVLEWNRYYDLYVAVGALALLFVAAAHRVVDSTFWIRLKAGQLIAEKGSPLWTDPFSFSMLGKPWVNVPWLYELVDFGIYRIGQAVSSSGGVIAVVAAHAVLFALTGLVLLSLRRPGPGLWWSAVCVVLALGAMLIPTRGEIARPFIWGLGGLAGAPTAGPETWGAALLAVELLLLFSATEKARAKAVAFPRSLIGLIVLFVVWANVHESVLIGLLVAAGWLVGAALRPRRGETPLPLPRALMVLGACALAVLVNPYLFRVYGAAVSPYTELLQPSTTLLGDQLSFFGKMSLDHYKTRHESAMYMRLYPAYYFAVVAVGLASFYVNKRHFSLARFLAYVVAALFWAVLIVNSIYFAVIWAAVMALNGQEWYLGRFGVAGRLNTGWRFWSEGGRAVTLLFLIAMLAKGLTGFGATLIEPPFGFGYSADDFPFEAAEYLRNPKIEGNVVNLGMAEGDALIWKAFPDRQTYIDKRKHVFSDALRNELDDLRRALRDGDKDAWRPILDRYKATVVMLDPRLLPRTYEGLFKSEDWIDFYDDGNTVLFGRSDAPARDLAYFRANRRNAEELVYRRAVESVPFIERPPTATTAMDAYFRGRTRVSTQPHVTAGYRWLGFQGGETEQLSIDPANCYAAIREARIALSHNPDDPNAYRLLKLAYQFLSAQESAILAQAGVSTPSNLGVFRFRQRATAVNFAIMSTPPPSTPEAKIELAGLHMELAQMYRGLEFYDLERDEMQAARALVPAGQFPAEDAERLAALERNIDKAESQLTDFTAEEQAGPTRRADYLLNRGLMGLAMRELEEAESQGESPATVKWRLLDLYCQIGRPDKALEQLGNLNVDDPALSTGPGTASYRQGLVNFLVGNYENTETFWEKRALTQLRASESVDALEAVRTLLRGEPRQAAESVQSIPNRLTNEATWEFELGLCYLESGQPEKAAAHLTQAVVLNPNLAVRPLIAYYLQRMGKVLPKLDDTEAPAEATP